MNLAQTQAEFSRSLLGGSTSPINLAISGPAPAQQLLQLYRNNFVISLTEMLEAVFPVTKRLVGEEFFLQLSKAYILACPLRQAAIESYGQGFPDFIDNCPQTDSLPYLSAMAQLEWNLEQAKACTLKENFPFQQLSEVPQTLQSSISFTLATGSQFMHSEFPVFSIWKAVQQQQFEGLDMGQSERLIIVPRPVESAELVLLSEPQFRLLAAFRDKQPLSELTLPPDFQELLSGWISAGIISGFELITEEIKHD
ncbi:MAG: DNA-binding domain-containing protein [Motiliproteus sp.]